MGLPIKWSDFDFEDNTIKVQRSIRQGIGYLGTFWKKATKFFKYSLN